MNGVINRTWIISAMLLVSVAMTGGCDYRSTALEDRMKDFQYSTDTLGEEMINRLKTAHVGKARKRQSTNSRAARVSEMEAGRGGDGDRPDPNSVEVIAADCAAKIRPIQEQGGGANAADAIIRQVDADGKIKQDVREAFAIALREELNGSIERISFG